MENANFDHETFIFLAIAWMYPIVFNLSFLCWLLIQSDIPYFHDFPIHIFCFKIFLEIELSMKLPS